MTRKEAAYILDPKTTREALRPYDYENVEIRIKVVEEACRIAAEVLRAMPEEPETSLEPVGPKGPLGTGCPSCGNMDVTWNLEKDVNVCQVCGWKGGLT